MYKFLFRNVFKNLYIEIFIKRISWNLESEPDVFAKFSSDIANNTYKRQTLTKNKVTEIRQSSDNLRHLFDMMRNWALNWQKTDL